MLDREHIFKIASEPSTCPVYPWQLKDDVTCGDIREQVLKFARAIEDAHRDLSLTSPRLLELQQIERRWNHQMQSEFAEYNALRANHPQRAMISEMTFEQYVQAVHDQIDTKLREQE